MHYFAQYVLVAFLNMSYAQYNPQSTAAEVTKTTRIEVQCLNIDFKATGETGPLKISAQVFEGTKVIDSSDWKISIQKDPTRDVLKIQCVFPEKIYSDKKLENQFRFQVLLKGTPSPLSVHSRNGKAEIQNWDQPSQIVLETGIINLKETSQTFKLNTLKGSIDVQKHTGRLKVEAFEGKITLNQVDGNIDLTNFSGPTGLKLVNGDVSLNSRLGSIVVDGGKGSIKFDADQGKLDIAQFDGSIEGVSDQAQITARLSNPARFKAKIKSANVKLSVPSSSGAQVSFALNEGSFQVPSYLKQDQYGSIKSAKGTLRGGETGRINIVGEAGRVTLGTH